MENFNLQNTKAIRIGDIRSATVLINAFPPKNQIIINKKSLSNLFRQAF